MSEFPGTLNIMNDISRLDGDLLLKVGIADETQAKFAATSFLEDVRKLHNNDPIVVTGEREAADKIRMSDAKAAGTDESIALNAGGHEFPGTLNIMNEISRLDGDLLLKVEIADETQAKFAATSFLEEDRKLHNNDSIVVTGERVAAGKIRMSEARAAGTDESIALNAGGHGNAAAITAKTKRKKKASKKVTEGK